MALLRDLFPTHARSTVSASSLRAPLRGELYPITVGTTSKRFAPPAAWLGSLVRMQADGGDLYVQLSNTAAPTTPDATADKDARAVETGTPLITLSPVAAGTGCFKVPDGTWLDVPFGADVTSFALQGSATMVARCHLSES
jgi:hypothetical protein